MIPGAYPSASSAFFTYVSNHRKHSFPLRFIVQQLPLIQVFFGVFGDDRILLKVYHRSTPIGWFVEHPASLIAVAKFSNHRTADDLIPFLRVQ